MLYPTELRGRMERRLDVWSIVAFPDKNVKYDFVRADGAQILRVRTAYYAKTARLSQESRAVGFW